MPLGEFIGQACAEFAMQAGGDAIRERYGCKGCAVVLIIVIAIIVVAGWYFTR